MRGIAEHEERSQMNNESILLLLILSAPAVGVAQIPARSLVLRSASSRRRKAIVRLMTLVHPRSSSQVITYLFRAHLPWTSHIAKPTSRCPFFVGWLLAVNLSTTS